MLPRLACCAALCAAGAFAADGKVPLSEANVIDGFGAPQGGGYEKDVPYNLLDEQDFVGDPRTAGKAAVKPLTMWCPGFVKWYYPHVFALVDLGATYQLSSVWAFHQFGSPIVNFTIGHNPFVHTDSWLYNGSDKANPMGNRHNGTLSWDNAWLGINTTASGRYVSVRMLDATTIHELVIYGTKIKASSPPAANVSAHKAPLMRELIGVNGFVDDPVERLNCAGAVREYQDWDWTEGADDPGFPHALNKFSPTYSSFDIDAFYAKTSAAGLDVHECLQGRSIFLSQGNATMQRWKPAPNALIEADDETALEQPSAYVAVAAHAFQTAARYGRKHVADSLLQLAPGQPRSTGLGTLKHIEIMNEPNGWWNDGGHGFMPPYQIASMMSAAYDGHEGTLGAGVGIKSADPSMGVIMSGITGTGRRNQDTVRMMLLWAQHHRKDGKFPADAINYHGYFGGGDSEQTSSDLPPEEAHMQQALANLTSWRDATLPQTKVWLTEFGWDTNQASPNRALAYGPYDGEHVQAMWLVRGLLAAAAGGLDRAHIYMLRNVNDRGTGKFTTCGLTSSKETGHTPKISWYYVSTLMTVIGDMAMVKPPVPPPLAAAATATATASVPLVAKFAPVAGDSRAEAGASAAYVVWLPSKTNAKIPNYELQLDANDDIELGNGDGKGKGKGLAAGQPLTLVELVMNSTNGNQSSIDASAGRVRIPMVSEVPVIVLVGAKPSPPTGPVPPITPPVYWQCKSKPATPPSPPMGLYCDSNTSASAYFVCPQGQHAECPDGQRCVQVPPAGAGQPGQIKCVDAPSPCQDKTPGLYCTPARPKPSPAWPDGYIVCPEELPLWCPTETPHCVQKGGGGASCVAAL